MLQLVRHARMVWMAIAEQASMLPTREDGSPDIDQGAAAVRDTTCLRAAAADLVSASDQRRRLRDTIADLAEHSDEVLGRWAHVMLNADAYAEVIDRYVELASGIAWLEAALDKFDPPEDARRWQRSRGCAPGPGGGCRVAELLTRGCALARSASRDRRRVHPP